MSNGLSQAEIDALLSGENSGADAPPPTDPNAMMTQEQIEAMLAGAGEQAPAALAPPSDPNAMMTQEQIEAMLAGVGSEAPAAVAPSSDPNAMMTQEQIEAMLAGVGSEAPAAVAPPSDPNAMMTPEQIANLLADAGDSSGTGPEVEIDPNLLSEIEIDALGEIGNISMGTAATTLFILLNHKVDITTPKVALTTMRRISEEYPMPFVAVEVQYTVGLEGTNILFLQEHDVKIITDLLMGGDGTNIPEELTELHLSAISEVMNQMVGSSSTSLAKLMGISIDISPPLAYQVSFPNDSHKVYSDLDEIIVRTSFDMVVEGLINSQLMQVTPLAFSKRMVANLLGGAASAAAGMSEAPVAAPAPQAPPQAPQPQAPQQQAPPPPQQQAPPPPPQQQMPQSPQQQMPPYQQPYQQPPYPQGGPPQGYDPYQQPPGYPPQPPMQQYQQPPYGYPPPPPYPQPPYSPPPPMQPYPPQPQYQQQMVDVQPAQFGSFDGSGPAGEFMGENMDLLMDVPLSVSVELGKSTKYIKEILDFNVGTIVVLDKLAGELVDIVVNGKLIAKGEVVVIDDNYGARITDIVSPSKRIAPK